MITTSGGNGMNIEELEMICFQLITVAGSAKSNYIEAIAKAKAGQYDEANKLIADADELLKQGHSPHIDLVQREAAGEDIHVSLILAHAEDQMMSMEVFKIMAEELVAVYKKINN